MCYIWKWNQKYGSNFFKLDHILHAYAKMKCYPELWELVCNKGPTHWAEKKKSGAIEYIHLYSYYFVW